MSTERTAWGAPVILTLAASQLFSLFGVALLLFVPLALVLIAVPPRRTGLIAFGLTLLILGVTRPGADMLWWIGRGWALILAAWFVGAVAVRPGSGFIHRGLIAVIGTLATATLLLVGNRGGWTQTDAVVAQKFQEQADSVIGKLGPQLAAKPWGGRAIEAAREAAVSQTRVFPALLGLASLCSLAVVWWLWRRISLREVRPLGSLREFRFRDELALPFLIAGVLLLLPVPLGDDVKRVALNVFVFIAPLFALRGFGIMMCLSGLPAGKFVEVAGYVLMFLLFLVTVPAALVVGVGDTWFDLRASARPLHSSD